MTENQNLVRKAGMRAVHTDVCHVFETEKKNMSQHAEMVMLTGKRDTVGTCN